MSVLLMQATLADTPEIQMRAAVVASLHGVEDPQNWAATHRYKLAGTTGWAQLLQSGLAATGDLDLSLITDEMIIDSVEAILISEMPPEPEPVVPEE